MRPERQGVFLSLGTEGGDGERRTFNLKRSTLNGHGEFKRYRPWKHQRFGVLMRRKGDSGRTFEGQHTTLG